MKDKNAWNSYDKEELAKLEKLCKAYSFMENLYAKIGQRIVQIRHANNLTQYQLAEMLDISVKHCSAIERGKSSLSLEKMIDLCDIFNIDLDYLIRGVQKTDDIPSYIPHTVVEIMTSDDEEKKQHFRDYIEIFNAISNSQSQ